MQKVEKVFDKGMGSYDLREKGAVSEIIHEMHRLNDQDSCAYPLVSWKFSDVTRKDFRWFKHINYPFLALELTLSGTLEYWSDGQRLLAPRGTLFLIAPGSNVRFANTGNISRRKVTLLIRGPMLPGLLSVLRFDQDQLLTLHNPELIEEKMRKIGNLLEQKETEEQNSVLTYELLLHLAAENPQPRYPELVRKALTLLQSRYSKKISATLIAEELHISLPTLNRLFRNHLGCPLHNYLTRYRLTQAAGMLTSQEIAVKVVAEKCGFSTPAQFGELFRKFYGVPPGAYRKNISR